MDASTRLQFILGNLRVNSSDVSDEEWEEILDEVVSWVKPIANYLSAFKSTDERDRAQNDGYWLHVPGRPVGTHRLIKVWQYAEGQELWLSEKGEWFKSTREGHQNRGRRSVRLSTKEVVALGETPLRYIDSLYALIATEIDSKQTRLENMREHAKALHAIATTFKDTGVTHS